MECKIDSAAPVARAAAPAQHMILFREKTAEHKYMCIDYQRDFVIDGKLYHHVEGYLYATEYAARGDAKAAELMQSQATALYCRWYYKKSPPPPCDASTWSNDIKLSHMRRAVLVRFISDKDAATRLLSTREDALVYNNHDDDYWGCGRAMRGQNMIGEVLMEVRGILRNAPTLTAIRA